MLTHEQFTQYAQAYIDTVFRVAYNYLHSSADADDVTQNVFLKLLMAEQDFQGEQHVKNWLIRTTLHQCSNLVHSRWWKRASYEDCVQGLTFENPARSDLFYAVMDLPKKYRLPIYLHYYEAYTTAEIGEMLKLPRSTVCTQLQRGRELLRQALEEV